MRFIFVASMMLGCTLAATAQSGRGAAPAAPAMTLTIPGYPDGGHIPVKFTQAAPGVAPGSENTSPSESTCVAASVVSRPSSRNGQNRRAPAPENLAGTVQGDQCQPAYLNDIRSPPAGW